MSDLALVLRVVVEHGAKYVPQFLGDFAFVVWNAATRSAVGACDAFAVNKLYYSLRRGLLCFASRGEALAYAERYEIQHLAELVAHCSPSPELSVYAGVTRLPAGTMILVDQGRLTTRQYWSSRELAPDPHWAKSEREAADTCRDLIVESVRLRLGNNGDAWAQLSGGMDSSSIVSTAQWLLQRGAVTHGLSGTVSYVDREDSATDEREYSDAVVSRWGVRNEVIIDAPIWFDERYSLPRTDEPRVDNMFYPRDRRLCEIVRAAGGRVLLTGVGGDELLTGIMFFFADWITEGRVWSAVREMARRAAIGRVSFWDLAYQNALLPFLPQAVRSRVAGADDHVPPWVQAATTRRYGLRERTFGAASYSGPVGRKYDHAVALHLDGIGRMLEFGVIGEVLDVRHPFLYRPLVEFALRLRPELCVRPYQRKWVLREAMRDILPDAVRTRIGKGTPAEVYARALTTQRSLLEPLVRDPILADLGVVDAVKLRESFDSAPCRPQRKGSLHGSISSTLSIEAWLQMRSGRWPRGVTKEVQ